MKYHAPAGARAALLPESLPFHGHFRLAYSGALLWGFLFGFSGPSEALRPSEFSKHNRSSASETLYSRVIDSLPGTEVFWVTRLGCLLRP